ncbi:capsular polysaccharide biosynthesis protein [Sedimentitalea sp. HM32M-2]|uniref:capsular polysaccharide biosynthesis protein n=1 Tax=Sedimentitalea sp. HM32M-2 TaxID=3351566 RepID=UPI003630DA53
MIATGADGTISEDRPRLFVFNAGFLTQKRVRRILALAGYDLRLGLPGPGDLVGVWGNSPTAHRGRHIAARRNLPLLSVEDAFLRSLHPGRAGEPAIGLVLDRGGVHFDAARSSDLEHLLATAPLDDTALLDRAREAMQRLREAHLSKYNAFDPAIPAPDPGYVLVIDQTRGDASVTASRGDTALFREMLVFAQEEHPGARVIIKTHPETAAGHRPGYFSAADVSARVQLLREPISPWSLLEGAVGVYTVSSQMGFEAILAGHRPRVFGQPFYAGWGLTGDQNPVPRRSRRLTRSQLFAAAMILYPTWYDPFRDRLCELETVLDNLEAQTRAWRQDHTGWVASGIRLWKRRPMQRMFGQQKPVRFTRTLPDPGGRRQLAWATKAPPDLSVTRVEDGFLRSRGLGAALVPPLSLVADDLGIHYDPTRPSRLERLIAGRVDLRPAQRRRAERLCAALTDAGLSKYNLGGALPDLPDGYRVLVPGQVEDDASVLTGTSRVRRNADLLRAARKQHPDAVLIYKPHPDVEAGLRPGAIAADCADVIATRTDPAALLTAVNEVWTMTSLLGFEALLRGVAVTTLGAPFYAGWGLTTDLGDVPADRRTARPDLMGLLHAALIDYPRYLDPVTGLICPVEVAVARLAGPQLYRPGAGLRTLSRLQGLFASFAPLWR